MKRNKLDILFMRYIRLRDRVCQRCGNRGDPRGMHTSHYWGRSIKATRWHPDNAVLVCYGCHVYFHGHPQDHTEFLRKRLGVGYELLDILAHSRPSKPDRTAIELDLKQLIGGLE